MQARALFLHTLFFIWVLGYNFVTCPVLLLPRKIILAFVRFQCRGVMLLLRWVAGVTYEIRGLENLQGPPVIVASKHQSTWETWIFHLLIQDPIFIMKRQLLHMPFTGWYFLRLGMIGVDRSGRHGEASKMVTECLDRLRARRTIVIFPEGTRTRAGSEGVYKQGVGILYGQASVSVVPAALNSGRFWRKDMVSRGGKIVLEFLPPIPPGLTVDAFMERLQRDVESASVRLNEEALGVGRTALPATSG